ncbi:MAG: NRDE family protein, partial [Candidatus Lambdaproteobacteria bacterium]|nr:NRDE family protein [Candidatus Lambdaproteobacteria bacterium]
MCLVLLALRAHPAAEIILAGNRDEHFRRPSAAPALIGRAPRIHAGLDLEAGGTWMGCNEAGLVAALTNRRARERPAPEGARSRGEIVLALLHQRDPARAAAWMEGL